MVSAVVSASCSSGRGAVVSGVAEGIIRILPGMDLPSKLLESAVQEIAQLPGIGEKTALRMALHLLRLPAQNTHRLAFALRQMVDELKTCSRCHNLSDQALCAVCAHPARDEQTICVVEDVRDFLAIENTGAYHGVYHVLGGKISPMDGIGPQDLHIADLVEKAAAGIDEIIFALSSTLEGDTTIFYIFKQIKHLPVRVTVLARGVGIGDELEYTDALTLGKSLSNRLPYESVLKH